jgi:hypothetical protein
MAGIIGLDIVAPGTSRKMATAAVNQLARVVPASTVPVAGQPVTGLQAARIGAAPVSLAAGYYYTALAAQDQARRDAETFGEPRIPIPLYNPILGDMPTIGLNPISGTPLEQPLKAVVRQTKRRASGFNKAISAGMKAVRSSRFMGKKGNISNSKRAFATVTKTVSGMKKGRKRPTKGVRGAIARAARRYI